MNPWKSIGLVKGWTPVQVVANQISASIPVRGRHYARVRIPFDTER